MAQLFSFDPKPRSAFTFQPVLDGQLATVVATWNIGGMRWFVSVYDVDGNRVVTLPMVSSSSPSPVAAAAWDALRRRAVLTTTAPHGVPLGIRTSMTVAGFRPAAWNGTFDCDVLSPTQLAVALPGDPGAAVVLGTTCAEVDLLGGYYASRMVYRGGARRFEVTP